VETNKYKTIAGASTGDFRDRGSKFLAFAYPVHTLQDVKEKLQGLKKEHPKAAHHCYAFRLGVDGLQFRATDDGEPAGSAGKPILGQIDSLGLTNALVVVVRYFGGTLLGIPGLLNAYKTVTLQALDTAPKTEKWIEALFEINFDYPAMGEALHLLKQNEATIYKQEMQLFCVVRAGIPKIFASDCIKKLCEIRSVKAAPITF
jgi:uncharacterized YigZ family protein